MLKLDKNELKGFLYAGIAAVALANSFIFSKLSLQELDFFQFGFWWFFLGVIWNIIYLVVNKNPIIFKPFTSVRFLNKPLISIAVLEAIATGLFYYAILIMENPGVVSFIGNIGPVFVTILGIIFLKEIFTRVQFLGIVLAISGIFTLNYRGYHGFSEILLPGSQYVILASFIFAIAAIIARKNHTRLDVGLLTYLRAILLLISFLVLVLINSNIFIPSALSLIYLSIGSLLEVLITIVFAYLSFKYIKAFKTSITISTKGVFALISSWMFLNLTPGVFQIIGGLLSLAGVVLISIKTTKKN